VELPGEVRVEALLTQADAAQLRIGMPMELVLVLVPAPGDGRLPVNTGGGYLANGEPIGASGLRQVHEIVLQLRGEAGERQVPGRCRVGFTQAYGAPGVSACTVLSR
jgi:acetyl-CoA acetyltransferase